MITRMRTVSNKQRAYKMATSVKCLSFLFVLLSSSSVFTLQPVNVKVSFDSQTSPDFKVLLSGVEWLRSGALSIRDNGQTWATTNKEMNILKLINQDTGSGEDLFGMFDTTT